MPDQTTQVTPEEAICIIKECAAQVYEALGPDYPEATYEKAMEIALRKRGLVFETQRMVPLFFDGVAIRDVRDELDLVVWAQEQDTSIAIIVDFKADSKIDSVHRMQVERYQRSLETELAGTKRVHSVGLIINFPKYKNRTLYAGLEQEGRVQFLSVGTADDAVTDSYTQDLWDPHSQLTPTGVATLQKLIEDREKDLAKERDKLASLELLLGLGLYSPAQYEECQDLQLYVQEEEERIVALRSRLNNMKVAAPDPGSSTQPARYTEAFWDDQGQLTPEGAGALQKLLGDREKAFLKTRDKLVSLELLLGLGLCSPEQDEECQDLRIQVQEEEERIAALRKHLDNLKGGTPAPGQSTQPASYTETFWDDQGQIKPEGLEDLEKVVAERDKALKKKRHALVDMEILAIFDLSPIQDQADYEILRRQVLEEEQRIALLKERLEELREIVKQSQSSP